MYLVPFRSYRSLLFKFWTLCVFELGLKDNVRCSSWVIGKRVVNFLLVLIELLSLGVTAEALRAKIDRKSAISLQSGQFDPKFHVEGITLTNNFCTDSWRMNALQHCVWQFSYKETLSQTFFKRNAILHGKRPFCGSGPPLGAYGQRTMIILGSLESV